MSDKTPDRCAQILAARDERFGEGDKMTTALAIAHRLTLQIEASEFQGIGDTREAARSRAARRFGLSESYLTRLVYRHGAMRDVSGQVFLTLQRAAEALERSAERADAHRKAIDDEISPRSVAVAAGADAPGAGATSTLHPPLLDRDAPAPRDPA